MSEATMIVVDGVRYRPEDAPARSRGGAAPAPRKARKTAANKARKTANTKAAKPADEQPELPDDDESSDG